VNAITARALQRVLTGDLHTDSELANLKPERALMRVASAQLRAIRAAMTTIGDSLSCESLPTDRDDDRGGWEPRDEFTMHDAFEALGGVTAMLHHGPDLLDEAEAAEQAEPAGRIAAE
jgi:hypothetical protein